MRINTNVSALNGARNLFMNTQASDTSMRKLSSGLRVSRAADDAAGLSIANKLRTQSRALSMASTNAQQAASMVQIADAATQTIQRIIERQKELIVQRESTGNNALVTASLAAEITTLSAEATRIQNTTNFLGSNVFSSLNFQVLDSSTNGTLNLNLSLSGYTALTGSSTLAQADTAIDAINSALSAIGANQNRLDYTIENLKTAVVNIRAAESVIRDVDMAEEMANFTKNQVLTQSATAMLAQANQMSQGILSLLR
jgi:flagellin